MHSLASVRFQIAAAAVGLGCTLGATTAAAPITTTYSTVDLVAEQASLPPRAEPSRWASISSPTRGGTPTGSTRATPGLLRGFAGDLAEGFEAAPFEFPVPHILPFIDLITYAYEERSCC